MAMVGVEDPFQNIDQAQQSSEILNALSGLNSPMRTDPSTSMPPPQSEYDRLTQQLKESPHQPELWRRLVDVAESSGDIDNISATYDALLKQYPNTAKAQIQYLSHFTSNEETFQKAEALFMKFLKGSPCVELWSFYLTYVRRLNSAPAQRDIVRKSYEFALSHIGQDKESGPIWHDYIQFLKAGDAGTTWEEQQKMDSLRKVYHRAVQIPLDNVERLWQDLESFETGLNKITAKKFMADLSPAHMQARTVYRQLSNHLTPLYAVHGQQELYLPSLPKFDGVERALVGKWKAYLKWEETNPLEIEEKDKTTLITRLMGVYRKAVIRMRYYTEIWFMAYTWANSVGKHDEALGFLKAGLEANPASYLLTFAYVESLEVKKEYAEVHAVYDKFLALLHTNLDTLEKTSAADTSSGSQTGATPGTGATNGNASIANISADQNSQNTSYSSSSSDENPKLTELQKQRTEYGLAWIMYMRFARRAEGVKSSRTVFGKARKDRWTPWEVFEAAALMEYHCSDDKTVASRVFEKGLEIYGDEIDFVQRYLVFLISINDQNNARALFERVISNFLPDKARPLWERWARYEYQYGDLEAALKLEKRMADVYPSDPPIKRLAQRHIYLGTDAIADRDLGFAYARRSGSGAGAGIGRTETAQSVLGSQPVSQPTKRPASPESRKREDVASGVAGGGRGEYGGGKRARAGSPGGRGSDRDRDGWRDGPPRRRFSPPPVPASWDRDGGPGGGRGRGHDRDDKPQRQPSVPNILSWFVGELPAPQSFDGPVFRTDDLMNLFRNAVIPSTSTRAKSPPAPPRGRPPPDYGPYQGPNNVPPRRRY